MRRRRGKTDREIVDDLIADEQIEFSEGAWMAIVSAVYFNTQPLPAAARERGAAWLKKYRGRAP